MSAEIVFNELQLDGVIIWDMVCGTIGHPCPKVGGDESRLTEVGPFMLPPPCSYVRPATVSSPRNYPHPPAQKLEGFELLTAFNDCFGGKDEEINFVGIEVEHKGSDTLRETTVRRNDKEQRVSDATAIRRSYPLSRKRSPSDDQEYHSRIQQNHPQGRKQSQPSGSD